MNLSFYSAAVGAGAHQANLDVVSNNIANCNTNGFKAKRGAFQDLLYTNLNAEAGADTDLKTGCGVRLEKADNSFTIGAFLETDRPLDYAITTENGFFALYNPQTQEITYTRDGSFSLSMQQDEEFYLTDSDGKWVLDVDLQPIVCENEYDLHANYNIGVFDFAIKNGMQNLGSNEFSPIEKNGQPILIGSQGFLKRGCIERSNVNLADEISQVIKAQRAFQYALKMVQTSDEIETTINSLR